MEIVASLEGLDLKGNRELIPNVSLTVQDPNGVRTDVTFSESSAGPHVGTYPDADIEGDYKLEFAGIEFYDHPLTGVRSSIRYKKTAHVEVVQAPTLAIAEPKWCIPQIR